MVRLRNYRETLSRRGVVWAVALAAVFAALAHFLPRPARAPWYQAPAVRLGAPVVRAARAITRAARAVWPSARRDRREMERLRAQVAAQAVALAAAEEVRLERDRLRVLERLRAEDGGGIAARVIACDPRAEFQTCLVDRGAADGVTAAMVAVAGAGLVGRVAQVAPHQAAILRLTDPHHVVDVFIQRSRVRGLLVGQGNAVVMERTEGVTRMEYVVDGADVVPGDVVVTTGLDERFPKGIPVGVVRAVRRGALGYYAAVEVTPFADWGAVEEVILR